MNRFKFRAWRIKENCYNHQEPFPTCCMQENGLLAYFNEERQMQNYIVEQCTGLKDKNGKLIYEGDIVKAYPLNIDFKPFNVKIVFDDEYFAFIGKVIGTPKRIGLENDSELFEIIGNIHENPELMEVNND